MLYLITTVILTYIYLVYVLGSIETIDFKSGNPLGDSLFMKESEKKSINDLPNTVILERTPEEKSPLQKLNELAQYNEIDYYFKLEKEEVGSI